MKPARPFYVIHDENVNMLIVFDIIYFFVYINCIKYLNTLGIGKKYPKHAVYATAY